MHKKSVAGVCVYIFVSQWVSKYSKYSHYRGGVVFRLFETLCYLSLQQDAAKLSCWTHILAEKIGTNSF